MDIIQEHLGRIKESMQALMEEHEMAREKVSQLDLIVVDIHHEVELEKMSGPAMMTKFKELQACLKLRRKYKNRVSRFQTIQALLDPDPYAEAIHALRKKEECEGRRTYTHRIRQDVRKEILEEVKSMEKKGQELSLTREGLL